MSLEAVLEPLVVNLPEVAAVPDTVPSGEGRAPLVDTTLREEGAPLEDTTLREETGAVVAEVAEEIGVRIHEAITETIGVRVAAEAHPTESIGDRTRPTWRVRKSSDGA
jgi:hypothetical protein